MNTSAAVMAKHGKSFYFASVLFPRRQFQKISRLYQICRTIDDTADEGDPTLAVPVLAEIRAQITDPRKPGLWQDWVSFAESEGVSRDHLLELLCGAEFDTQGGVITDEANLKQYCYRVAGVVGLMMCPLLGVQNPQAQAHAVSLGIAMQITNICRDVKEDAESGRIYFPINQLKDSGLTAMAISQSSMTPESLRRVVKNHLDLADDLYREGYKGLAYIPFRARIIIALAGEVYRHIGEKIRKRNYDVHAGRVHLGLAEKLLVAIKSIRFLWTKEFWQAPQIEKHP